MEVDIMNQYVTRTIIKELRERNKMTQLQLADKLGVTERHAYIILKARPNY